MAFEYAAFFADVNRLYDRLEELHGIDAVLDGIESRGLDTLYYPPHNYTGGGPFNRVIELGTTYPFDKIIRAVDVETSGGSSYPNYTTPSTSTSQHDFSWVEDAYSDASTWRLSAQSSLGSTFEPLLEVNSDRFQQVSYAIVDMYASMDTSLRDDWSGLANQTAEWEGRAADSFFRNFQGPMTDVIAGHKFALDYLNSLVCAMKVFNDAGQHSLHALVRECLDIVDDQLRKRQAENRDASDGEALVLLATLTGIGAALAFPLPGAAAALGATSAMLSYAASSVPPAMAEPVEITARSATQLDDKLGSEIIELKRNVRAGFDSVDDKATEMDGYVEELKTPLPGSPANAWIPIRPDIAPGDDFYHESRNYS